MKAMANTWQAHAWALSEFGGADLGHEARTKRAVRFATALVQNPSASIPRVVRDAHQAKGAYRLLSNPKVDHDAILTGHIAQTVERCRGKDAILAIQDTTALSYTAREGLGPVTNRGKARGFLAHTALAVSFDGGDEVLGVLYQRVWARSDEKLTQGESCVARKKRPRESEHWPATQRRIAEHFSQMQGRPRVIAVFDREGDIFEGFEALDEIGHSFIIRAAWNRLLETDGDDKQYSLDAVKQAPVRAHRTVRVPGRAGQAARSAEMEIRAMTAVIRPPRNRGRHGESVSLNIVLALETNRAADADPLCWYLVTREPIETERDVLAVMRGYELRWLIEELHMGIKTGCSAEERQLESLGALENFLAFATVIAWQMLRLRDASRRAEPVPAAQILTATQMRVLRALRPRLKPDCSAAEALRAIATLGGFMGRKSDGNPGWRTLWAGWESLLIAEAGFLIGKRESG